MFGGLIKRRLGFASLEIEDLMGDAEAFRRTEEEVEEAELREAGKAALAAHEAEHGVEEKEEAVDLLAGGGGGGGDITFSSTANAVGGGAVSGNDAVKSYGTALSPKHSVRRSVNVPRGGGGGDGGNNLQEPLLAKSGGADEVEAAREQHIVSMKRAAMEQGHYAGYEWTNKNSYDLSKTQPDYMEKRGSFDDELEDQMDLRPFLQIPFFWGKDPVRTVGYFKGLIAFTDHKKAADPLSDLAVLKEIRTPTPLYLRLYILSGTKLIPRDSDGASDPYLVIKIGKERRSTRNDYLSNTLEPGFYHSTEIPVMMPGHVGNGRVDLE